MNKQNFLQILSDFINARKILSLPDVDWEEISLFAQKHQISGIVYYQCKDLIDNPRIKTVLQKSYVSSLYANKNFAKNYRTISSLLAEKNIAFVPVKGFQIAQLYPIPELRTMGDIDVLARDVDFTLIAEVFLQQGFQYGKETAHEITFRKGTFYYEIHEFMIDKPAGEDEIQKSYYNDYWNHLVTGGEYGEQILDWSFHFMYLLQHMRQHILWEGIGFRQFMDMAIVIRNVPELDWEYIVASSRQVELYDFLVRVLSLIEKWFGVKVPIKTVAITDEFYEYVTNKVFDDGVFGFDNDDNKINVFERDYHKSNGPLVVMKIKNITAILFPSYNKLCQSQQYAFIKGKWYLLPIAWIYRFIIALKQRKFSKMKKINRIANIKEEQLNKRRCDIEMWGL